MNTKKIVLSVIGIISVVFTLYAQAPPSTMDLLTRPSRWAIKWELEERVQDYTILRFTNTNMTMGMMIDGDELSHSRAYYLSNTIPTVFDAAKVGTATDGTYIVAIGNDGIDVFEILELTDEKLKMLFDSHGTHRV